MPSEIKDKRSSPSSKGRQDLLKYGCIPLLPDVPIGQNHNLKEERLIKIFYGSKYNALNSRTMPPGDLQVIPNSLAEIA
jgi:hypothetical protein